MATNKAAQIDVAGAKELRQVLKDLGDRALLRELAANNAEIADIVVADAKRRAGAGREAKVASRLQARKSAGNVSIRLPVLVDVNDKRGLRPVGMGTEFGAKYQRRLVKNTGGRKTIVRDGEDLDRVIKRVESQTVQANQYGFGGTDTVRKRTRALGNKAVKVTKVIIGWKGYKPWRGNGQTAGYFLFPAIRANRERIIEMYVKSIEDIWSRKKAA